MTKQLRDALYLRACDVDLNWGGATAGKELCQAPATTPTMYDGTRVVVFRRWRQDADVPDHVDVFMDGVLHETVKLSLNDCRDGTILHKMFARKRIQKLQERQKRL